MCVCNTFPYLDFVCKVAGIQKRAIRSQQRKQHRPTVVCFSVSKPSSLLALLYFTLLLLGCTSIAQERMTNSKDFSYWTVWRVAALRNTLYYNSQSCKYIVVSSLNLSHSTTYLYIIFNPTTLSLCQKSRRRQFSCPGPPFKILYFSIPLCQRQIRILNIGLTTKLVEIRKNG